MKSLVVIVSQLNLTSGFSMQGEQIANIYAFILSINTKLS